MTVVRNRLWPLKRIRTLSEFGLFTYVVVFASCVPILMRLPLPWLARVVTRAPRRRRVSAQEVDRLAEFVSLAPVVASPAVRNGCLTRGITLYWFLRRAGMPVELRFGLDPASTSAGADGHCWLTLDGAPFLERVDPRDHFSELYCFPLVEA